MQNKQAMFIRRMQVCKYAGYRPPATTISFYSTTSSSPEKKKTSSNRLGAPLSRGLRGQKGLRPFNPLQNRKYAGCKYATKQVYKSARMQGCNDGRIHGCKFASAQAWKHASEQEGKHAIMHGCKLYKYASVPVST